MEAKNKNAVIVSNCGFIENVLCYNEVFEICDLIFDFLCKFINRNSCVALNMSHNIYIPSIILSLQKLDYCFIFLPDDSELESITEQLGIEWILSISKTEKTPTSLTLKDCNLNLRKTSCKQSKIYKDIFYIIRTSGTTGENKFVKVGKFSIESNIKCLTRIFNIQEHDIIYFGTPLTFDPSMIELLLALENKACLLIPSLKSQINPIKLYQTLFHVENGITILQIVPSLFLRWSKEQIQAILLNKKLKVLAFGGECFPQSILNYKTSINLRVFNLYGITELSCWATIYEIPKESINEIPLGVNLDDTIVEVRDFSNNKKIHEGEGEIFIGSKDRICLINEEISDKTVRFISTGDTAYINKTGIFYKGRTNDTFKRFGHKLHLSKIEEMVEKQTGLINKSIWLKEESKLLLFIIIEDSNIKAKDKILDKIRIKLLHSLPKHYFPDFIDIIHKCPVTSHGKTNRKVLQLIYQNQEKTQKSPRKILTSLICKYFGLNPENLENIYNSTFFDLGGNSILAVQFLNEFNDEIKTETPELVKAIFEENIQQCFKAVKNLKSGKRKPQELIESNPTVKRNKTQVELKIIWKYNLEACVDTTPFVFRHNEKILAAVGSFSHIFAVLDASNGTEVAKYILPDIIEASPCLSSCKNFLYVSCFDGCLYCLEFSTNKIKWTYSTSERIKCKPTLGKTTIIFGSYDKYIHCINSDGVLIWKTFVEESVTATPLIEKEKLYVATICGTCLCLLESTGEILWKLKTSSPIFGTPAIINSSIAYPNVDGSIMFLSLDGVKLQVFECSGHLYSSISVYNDYIIFGTQLGNLYILEFSDNKAKMKCLVNIDDGLTTPSVFKNKMIVAGNSGHLFIVNFDGRLEGDICLPNNIFASVVINGNYIYVGCRDNNLYCVEIIE